MEDSALGRVEDLEKRIKKLESRSNRKEEKG